MNVDHLARAESSLYAEMLNCGTFELKHEHNQKHRIYEGWRFIFESYCSFALSGDIEALKRALFYVWYGQFEPPVLSGISELPEIEVEAILRELDQLAGDGGLDRELSWMLPYYYMACDYYFDGISNLESLRAFSINGEEHWKSEIHASSFLERGQLGWYWESMARK